jgi:hypothetical protein
LNEDVIAYNPKQIKPKKMPNQEEKNRSLLDPMEILKLSKTLTPKNKKKVISLIK